MSAELSPKLPRKKPSVMWWIGGVFLLLVALFLFQLFGPSPPIVVSLQTTYITGPLRSNGLPDYEQYVLERGQQGVTPENNAAVLMWQAMWPGDLEPQDYAPVARALGLSAIPSEEGTLEPVYSEACRERIRAWLQETGRLPGDDMMAEEDEAYFIDEFIDAARDRPWKSEQLPPLAAWVAANQKPLDLIVAATARPKYFSPSPTLINGKDDLLINILLPDLQSSRSAARALSARAMWNVGEDRLDAAWVDLLALHRYSHLLAQGQTIIDQLIGIAINGIATEGTIALLDHPALTAEQAMQIHDDLARLGDFTSMASTFTGLERMWGLELVIRLSTGEITAEELDFYGTVAGLDAFATFDILSIDWNYVLELTNHWYDRLAAAARTVDFTARKNALHQIETDLDQATSQMRRPIQWVGSALSRQQRSELAAGIVLGMVLPATSTATAAEDRANVKLRLLQVAAALAAYRAEHGTYPEQLTDLVSAQLAELPDDLFLSTSQPFLYLPDAAGYLLYSIGANGLDDGGSNGMMDILAGRSLENSDTDETEALREQLPIGADDWAIRVPRPVFQMPEIPSPE